MPEEIERFVAEYKAAGMTMAETIKAVRNTFRVGLDEAKKIVAAQPCWSSIVASSQVPQDDAIRAIEETSRSKDTKRSSDASD
jgi:ribosomal protein L7/L12